jgi:hypothetical protein
VVVPPPGAEPNDQCQYSPIDRPSTLLQPIGPATAANWSKREVPNPTSPEKSTVIPQPWLDRPGGDVANSPGLR